MKKLLLSIWLLPGLAISTATCQPVASGPKQSTLAASSAGTDSLKPSFEVASALPDPYYHEAEQYVAQLYGYTVRHLGGEVTDSTEKAITQNNERLIQQLQQTHPGITLDDLVNEMQDYVSTTRSIENVVLRVMNKRMKANPHCVYTRLTWLPDKEKGWYIVAVYTTVSNKNDPDSLSYRMKINPSTNDYMLQNDQGQWVEL